MQPQKVKRAVAARLRSTTGPAVLEVHVDPAEPATTPDTLTS
ncbi:MAG TPA: hypothetical protein VL689_15800 [Paraburkholderia sp.]|nr:hypothetical protein [Paraburkholderia sp.]